MTKDHRPTTWLICQNRAEWRDWLRNNHLEETEVWLQISKAKSKQTGVLLKEAVAEALCFGWIDGKMYRLDDEKFIIRVTPRGKNSVWSLVNRELAEDLIMQGLMAHSGFDAIEGAKANGQWDNAYSSKVVPELPNDLRQALMKDENTMNNFLGWSNSHKVHAITWITESKRQLTRTNRIEKIVMLAKNNQRPF